ncbi:MAG TPA: hypothetical protein VKQ28_00750 [Candidatus Acidoferrum sp.]|nr:hypothetical protein [Candidatus Acidoferrum sp.]
MKKKISVVAATAVALLLVFAGSAWLHPVKAVIPSGNLSFAGGVYNSASYSQWGMSVAAGNSATGSQAITVCPEYVQLPDGRAFRPLAPANGVFTPFTIDPAGSASETVTPTAYSSVTAPAGYPGGQNGTCASVTATFANTHGTSLAPNQVIPSDQGIQEAINDAALNNGGIVWWKIDPGIVTLSTGAPTTSLGSVNIPARSIVMSATARVTTTIATCAGGWSLGLTGGTGTDLTAANTTLTAGTTTESSTIKTPVNTAAIAAGVPTAFCTTSNASAGALHAHIEGYKLVAPAQ